MDTYTEEVSGGIAVGMPVSRESRYFSATTKGEASTQTITMDLRPLRQVLLRRETSGRPLR